MTATALLPRYTSYPAFASVGRYNTCCVRKLPAYCSAASLPRNCHSPDYDESFTINNMRLVDTSTGNLIGTFYKDDTGTVHNDGYDVETFHYEEVSNGEGGTVTQAHFGIPWGTADTQAISDGATIRMEIGYLDEASNEFTVLAYAEETYGNLQQDHHPSGISAATLAPMAFSISVGSPNCMAIGGTLQRTAAVISDS